MKQAFQKWGGWCLRFLLIIASVFVALAILLPLNIPAIEAHAGSGDNNTFYGQDGVYEDGWTERTVISEWIDMRRLAGSTATDSSIACGTYPLDPDNYDPDKVGNLKRGTICINTASLPDDIYIFSAYLRLYCSAYSGAGNCVEGEAPGLSLKPRVVITASDKETAYSSIVVADYKTFNDTRLSVSQVPTPLTHMTFWLNQDGLNYIKRTGVTVFGVRDYIWDTLDNDPCGSHCGTGNWNFVTTFSSLEAAGTQNDPILVVYWGDMPIDREDIDDPENEEEGGAGDNVSAIDWYTVRCAYADEDLGFRVSGSAGTELQLRLVDQHDNIIDQIDDSIRVDGNFYWSAGCGLGDRGFVRVTDLLHPTKFSDWGYIAQKPDNSQIHNYTYAERTEYPQYDVSLVEYIKGEQNLMLVHWKTDVQADEHNEYSLRLYHLGDPGDTVYNEVFADMLDDYYKNVNANNDFQIGIRYAVFGFDPADNWTGLVNDLDLPYIGANTGFYQSLIYQEGVGEYSTTHSAHCYLEGLDGILLSLNESDADYNAGSPIALTIAIDDETGWADMWDSYKVENCYGLKTGDGLIITQTVEGDLATRHFSVGQGLTTSGSKGDYWLRVTFYDDGGDCTYSYVHDVPYSVWGGGKPGDGRGEVPELPGFWGTDIGHWLIILGLIVLAGIIFWRHKVVASILALGFIGAGIVVGWLDPWVIALLALGAGVTIFFLLRRGHKEEG